jgi:ABC-type proline/glycine betaine transport system ATPase subunit
MLSTRARTNKISERDIILIDEPDQSLYPTSARHLRDELIEISKKARVIYSTHSQYMIDTECIERHLVIEKKDDEITTICKETGVSPYSEDELLRRAIGASIFECLQEKNIIFEGWLDKELFDKFCKSNKINDFKNAGKTFLKGIPSYEILVSILIMANKKFIIVSDSDDVSKSKQKEFVKHFPEYKDNWIAYGDVDQSIATLEDFVNATTIETVIKANITTKFNYDTNKNAIANIDASVKNVESSVKDKTKQDIKKTIIKIAKKDDIKASYGDFVNKLKEKMDKL